MKRDLAKKEHLEWREKVLQRDNYKCVICGGGPKYMNAHHLIPRNFKEYSFDVDNGLTLCPKHHTLGKWSAHKNPMWFSRWMRIHQNIIYQQVIVRLRELIEEENNENEYDL